VRFYQLTETSGSTANDSSSAHVNGSYDGPVQFGGAGPLLDESTTAPAFDGGAYDVGIKLPAPLSAAGSYSIETWVRPSFSGTYMTIWGSSTSKRLLVNPSGYLLSQFNGNFTSTHTLSNHAWHHVVFVYNASTSTQSYYIDGKLDSSASLAPSTAAFTSAYYLGEYDTSGYYKWHGGIAEHAVYNYALSSSQILAHYNAAGYPPATPTPAPTSAPTPASDSPCAGYRWPVKVATDSNASSIALSPMTNTTVTYLAGIPKPNTNNTLPRLIPAEARPYELVDAILTEYFKASDYDYHLVMQDAQGHTIISESPDPTCAKGSVLYNEIASVHQQIAAEFPGISTTPTKVSMPVTVEGIPFFDYVPNYATGESANGIELHPILAICFGSGCTLKPPTPSPSPSPTASPSPTPVPTATPSSGPYERSVLANAPREYYELNDSNGPTAYDSSGNAHNGTYVGAVTYGVSGPLRDEPSTAISLPGGTASEGVQLPNPNAAAGASYTIELWVDPAPSSNYLTLWGYNASHRLLLSGGGQLLSQFSGNFYSKNTLARNVWHQIVFVYNASTQTESYYIDGSFDSSASLSTSAAAFTSTYYLGQYDTSTNYKWYGRMAQAAFYPSALTASQIASHYSTAGYGSPTPSPAPTPTPTATPAPTPTPAGTPPPTPTPTATPTATPAPTPTPTGLTYQGAVLADSPFEYLQLEEASGPTAVDSSGNNHSGTYIGSITFGVAGPLKSASSTAISLPGGTAGEGVQVPNPNAAAGTSYTIELWVDAAPASSYMTLWGYSSTHRLLLSNTGQLLSQLGGNFFSKTTLTRNVWHYVAFVYNAPAQTASYYIDGAFDSNSSLSTSAAAFTSAYYLGQYDTSTNYKWNGRLAQAAFYESALDATQIAQHYSAAGY
jgi:hypothetical protein